VIVLPESVEVGVGVTAGVPRAVATVRETAAEVAEAPVPSVTVKLNEYVPVVVEVTVQVVLEELQPDETVTPVGRFQVYV
jgi:hypothetical protein